MEEIAAVLGDGARWRIVESLAERPRSVGELAELTGLRQPQTTKHLQTLARAGLVAVYPLGQRRVYALESQPLARLARRLRQLVDAVEASADERDVVERYRAAIAVETARADAESWADGRTFHFERLLNASPETVWRHWIEPQLLAGWWAPPSLTIVECVIEPWPQGRAVLDYRDAEGRRYRSDGSVREARPPERLDFDLTVRDADGSTAFTAHYDVRLHDSPEGTRLLLDLRLDETAVEAATFIAGIETGWGQVLDKLADAVGDTETTDG